MNTWIAGKNLMKHHCLIKNIFIAAINITDIDCRHAKRIFKIFNNKNIGDYHKSLLLTDDLKILEICILKNINLILLIFYLHQD